MDRPMNSKSERAGEIVAHLVALVRQAAEDPTAIADLEQEARSLGDRLVEMLEESDDQANGMSTDPQHAPGKLEVKDVRGRTVWLHLVTGQVTATRTPGPPPPSPHWVVEIDGTTYLDPISWDVGDVDAVTVRPRVERWSDDHLEAFR